MQLNPLAVALAIVVGAGAARADTTFTSKVQVYSDSDHTTVISPLVQAAADISPTTSVNLGYVADAVSSASVDVVTQASKTRIHDTRQQASGGFAHAFGTLSWHASYAYSHENDYQSNNLSTGLDEQLFDKNTTLSLGYALSLDDVGRAHDVNFSRSLAVNSASAAWTQILSPRLIGQLTYEFTYASGFQSSPYRFVPVRASLDAAPEFWVMETDPAERVRNAIVLGVNRALGATSSIQGDYRFYFDDWGITSHTLGARYFVHLTPKLELRLRERFYIQTGATFYQDNYSSAEKYMTYDRELSALWSETFGAAVYYAITPRVEAELKADVFYYYYEDFPPLLDRVGANTGVGVTVTY
jgi:Protein of unknown function (DUF3570)